MTRLTASVFMVLMLSVPAFAGSKTKARKTSSSEYKYIMVPKYKVCLETSKVGENVVSVKRLAKEGCDVTPGDDFAIVDCRAVPSMVREGYGMFAYAKTLNSCEMIKRFVVKQ